ncbi:MAG: hypothetical protein H6648_06870 [Caldilineae bacterium]|nr:hypothetical protein [Chloroflexota bacterium]MCB9176868.1 hypothetical protein [Caldilineae bacterium]
MSLRDVARLALATAAWRGLGSDRAGRMLIEGLGAEDEGTQVAAGMLIERAGGRDLVRQAIQRGEQLPIALTLLGDLGRAEDRPLLRSFLDHAEPEVARAAESALALMAARGIRDDEADG